MYQQCCTILQSVSDDVAQQHVALRGVMVEWRHTLSLSSKRPESPPKWNHKSINPVRQNETYLAWTFPHHLETLNESFGVPAMNTKGSVVCIERLSASSVSTKCTLRAYIWRKALGLKNHLILKNSWQTNRGNINRCMIASLDHQLWCPWSSGRCSETVKWEARVSIRCLFREMRVCGGKVNFAEFLFFI